MAKEIKQLVISNPAANTGTLVFQHTQPVGQPNSGLFLANVLVNNKSIADSRFDIWISSASPSASANFGYIAKDQVIYGRDTYETSKFTMKINDRLFIKAATASVGFVVNGVNQSEVDP
jgi:hypothetical protein